MLITQCSHWTPCSLEAPFRPGHSRILWLLVTTLQGLWLTGRSDGAADGKEREGTGAPPSPTLKASQESVLVPPPPGPLPGPGMSLHRKPFFPCHPRAQPNLTAAPEGTQIGSGLKQLTISSLACASTLHVVPGPDSAHLHWGQCPGFPIQLLARPVLSIPRVPPRPAHWVATATVVRWSHLCARVCFGGAGSYSTDLENESGIYLWEFL